MNGTTAFPTLALAAALLSACSEKTPIEPDAAGTGPGTLRVATVTTGENIYSDGYVVVVDGENEQAIGVSGTLAITGLAAGVHEVTLVGVAANCTVTGSNPRTITVSAGETVGTTFAVSCWRMLGALEITTVTTGEDVDADGYWLVDEWDMWGPITRTIGVNEVVRIGGLDVGVHGVELADVAVNCTVSGSNARAVTVTADDTASIVFEVACEARDPLPGRIAFHSNRSGNHDVYLMDTDGLGHRRLTTHSAFDGAPAVSPDGTRILFETDRDGNREIYVMNDDGREVSNLTNHPATDGMPSWSPDATKILFVSDREGSLDIFVMNADGSGPVKLAQSGVSSPAAWSPDGSQILFSSNRAGVIDIFSMKLDGSEPVNLTNHADAADLAPAWSPDGKRIAFTRQPPASTPTGNIYLMNPDGSNPVNLTNNSAAENVLPSWSPDGSRIVFSSRRTGNHQVFIMKADGSEPVNLSRSPWWDALPGSPQAWRP